MKSQGMSVEQTQHELKQKLTLGTRPWIYLEAVCRQKILLRWLKWALDGASRKCNGGLLKTYLAN